MNQEERKCPNCGAIYSPWHSYCAECGTELGKMPPMEDEMLDGYDLPTWRMFIDKNTGHYMPVFMKNKDKKVFFHINWSAMFFTVYWMFYRKMYKYAFIFLAVSLVFSLALSTVGALIIKPEIEHAFSIIEPYREQLDEDNYTIDMDMIEAQRARYEYDSVVNAAMGRLTFCTLIASLLFNIAFGLLADCIYRAHIRRNITKKDGGTSGWSLAGGVLVYRCFSTFVETPLISVIVSLLLVNIRA